MVIKTLLRCFELILGLKVNFYKISVGAIGVNEEVRLIWSKCLNCQTMLVPFTYLGKNIGGNPRRALFWKSIIHRIKSRLYRWKGKVLSLAVRYA